MAERLGGSLAFGGERIFAKNPPVTAAAFSVIASANTLCREGTDLFANGPVEG
jgi:hypothetical protein